MSYILFCAFLVSITTFETGVQGIGWVRSTEPQCGENKILRCCIEHYANKIFPEMQKDIEDGLSKYWSLNIKNNNEVEAIIELEKNIRDLLKEFAKSPLPDDEVEDTIDNILKMVTASISDVRLAIPSIRQNKNTSPTNAEEITKELVILLQKIPQKVKNITDKVRKCAQKA